MIYQVKCPNCGAVTVNDRPKDRLCCDCDEKRKREEEAKMRRA